jgi:hypothetical protein
MVTNQRERHNGMVNYHTLALNINQRPSSAFASQSRR